MLKRLVLGALGVLGLLIAVLVVRALTATSLQPDITPLTVPAVDADAAAERLAQSVRFKTVAPREGAELDAAPFEAFHGWIDASFPSVHAGLRREVVAGHSLLYTWKGLNPELPPLLLLAHQDVVPVEDSTLPDWEKPPFAGVVADGWVWGRGTLDDKVSMVGILEAVEGLWKAGLQPQRTIMLAFGHDEEVSGSGARAIAELLAQRGVSPLLVLDEGLAVTHGIVPGLDQPAALVGLAEKGYLSVELTVTGDGGHSSMPPAHTTVGVLAEAITRLEATRCRLTWTAPCPRCWRPWGPRWTSATGWCSATCGCSAAWFAPSSRRATPRTPPSARRLR